MTKRKNIKVSVETADALAGWIARESERLGVRVTVNDAIQKLISLADSQVTPTCIPSDSHMGVNCIPPDSQVTPTWDTSDSQVTPSDRLQPRVRVTRASVPARSSTTKDLDEEDSPHLSSRDSDLVTEESGIRARVRDTRRVTAEWFVGRWNKWAEEHTGDGFRPKVVDLLTERPSRGYLEGLLREFHNQRTKNPDPEQWAKAFDALDALPDLAARKLRLDGPEKLFGWTRNDPTERPKLWRIADGEWSDWTGDTKQIAATPKPKHHTYESDDTFCAIPIDGSSPDAKRAVLLADSCWDDTLTEEQREQALLETLAICERNHWDPISRLHVDWVDNRTIRSQR